MRLSTVTKTLRAGRGRLLLALLRLAREAYRVEFLAAASRSGLLEQLATGPQSVSTLATELGVPPDAEQALLSWLRIGERLGELAFQGDAVRLRGFWAKALLHPEHDAIRAMIEQFARYRHVHDAIDLLREGRTLATSDADSALIARASRIAEPLVEEALDAAVPRTGPVRMLEVGCGLGHYIRHAAKRNPELTAVGVELDVGIARRAARNMVRWGIATRADIIAGDVRTLNLDVGGYEVITMHDNIYTFPLHDRVPLIRQLAGLLARDGRLLLTTSCRGGSLSMEVLNLYWTLADRGGALPAADELCAQLRDAGLTGVTARRLVPGVGYYAFVAQAGAAVRRTRHEPRAAHV